MKPHVTKTKMSFEEVRQMMDDFYEEVETKEKADGAVMHVVAQCTRDKGLMARLRRILGLDLKDNQ